MTFISNESPNRRSRVIGVQRAADRPFREGTKMQRKIALVASNAPAAMEAEAELRPLYDFVDLAEADLLIALGGDGFLLHMLHPLLDQRRSLPVFGMHRGTIGFLMNRSEEPTSALQSLMRNSY